MSDCRFGVSPVNYPDPDQKELCLLIHRAQGQVELIVAGRTGGKRMLEISSYFK